MAKPNYRFDKRQRELKKNQKQEEKLLKKRARNAAAPMDDGGAVQSKDEASPKSEEIQ